MSTMPREAVKTEWAKPEAPDIENMSQADVRKLLIYRSQFLEEATEFYKKFVEYIYTMPIHAVFRQHAFLNIDQGMHWVQKGIDNIWDMPEQETESVQASLENA